MVATSNTTGTAESRFYAEVILDIDVLKHVHSQGTVCRISLISTVGLDLWHLRSSPLSWLPMLVRR